MAASSFSLGRRPTQGGSGGGGGKSRTFLFIFVILWFSSLQIVLFTWTQIPSASRLLGLDGRDTSSMMMLSVSGSGSGSGSSNNSRCQKLSSDNELQQLCLLLHQIWQAVPEPRNRHKKGERRVFPNAVVRQASPSAQLSSLQSSDTVVLATHLNVQKLDILLIQAKWWGGPVSASLYLQSANEVDTFVRFYQSHGHTELQGVSFHVVLEKTALPYPHNVLRNLALEYLDADFFVAADVDFIPNFGAYQQLDTLLHEPQSIVKQQLMAHRVLVVPAFERFQTSSDVSVTEDMLPRTKAELQHMVKVDKTMIGFHMAGSPMGHGPTNFPKWLKNKTDVTYDIEYKNVFEPYAMGYLPGIPRYWEDFRGYGYNKFSWYMELNRGCYHFGVLRDFFLVHMNHPMVSRQAKHDQTEQNREHWLEFKKYLNVRYKQACDMLPPPPSGLIHNA